MWFLCPNCLCSTSIGHARKRHQHWPNPISYTKQLCHWPPNDPSKNEKNKKEALNCNYLHLMMEWANYTTHWVSFVSNQLAFVVCHKGIKKANILSILTSTRPSRAKHSALVSLNFGQAGAILRAPSAWYTKIRFTTKWVSMKNPRHLPWLNGIKKSRHLLTGRSKVPFLIRLGNLFAKAAQLFALFLVFIANVIVRADVSEFFDG